MLGRMSLLLVPMLMLLMLSALASLPAEDGGRPLRGDTRDQVISLLGNPQGTITIAPTSTGKADEILCYGDLLIEFIAGRVSRISGIGHWQRAASAPFPDAPQAAERDVDAAIGHGPDILDEDRAPSDRPIAAVSVVVVEYVQPEWGGYGHDSGHGQYRRSHGRRGWHGQASCGTTAPFPQDPSIAVSTFPLDVVRHAPDPRQSVFDLPDPRTAVLTAPDPRWHGDAQRR